MAHQYAKINPKRNGIADVGNAQIHVVHGAVVAETMGHAASTGLVEDEETEVKFGTNPNIQIATPEETNAFGNLTRLTSASTFDVVSDSIADDGSPTGTGAWTIRIHYLDSSYVEQTEDVTLNGVTPVTTTGSGIRLLRAYCLGVGSGGQNAGNITITATTGGTTQGYIIAGTGQTQQIAFTVPAGYTAYILGAQFSLAETKGGALKETTAFIEGRVRFYDETSTNNYQSWRSIFQVDLNNHGSGSSPLPQETLEPIPEKSDVTILVTVGANDTSSTARLFILLREN